LVVGLTACSAAVPVNMNGEYLIANPNTLSKAPFSTDYGTKNAEFVDVYTPPIRTVYGEVFWTMMDTINLPEDIVNRFDNKTIAVIGYEVDQVYKKDSGDVSVPIFWAYNHHYEAYMLGKHSSLEEVKSDVLQARGMNHGAPTYWKIKSTNPDRLSTIPDAQFFSEGNGGEFRKSFHGYPAGFAQLVNSPTIVKVQPMQIDTHNRDYNGPGFKAGLLPRSSTAPPNASYSGLLECPCTTRAIKNWTTTYTTATSGQCGTAITNASECFMAAGRVGQTPSTTAVVSSATLPSGCVVVDHVNGSVSAMFNTYQSTVACGSGAKQFAGAVKSLVTAGLELDTTVAGGQATITISGPGSVWFGLAFNAHGMSEQPYTVIVDGSGNVTERKIGDHDAGVQLQPTQVTVVSNTVTAGVRTVVLRRAFRGATADHYTFDPTTASLPLLMAVGAGPQLAYHKNRTTATMAIAAIETPTCVCDAGTHGTINGLSFSKNCAPEPYGDLLQQKNPTCWIQTYQGGLSCCHHRDILLDADQPIDNRTDEYHLKYRFWFQDYVPATATAPASHQNLHRFYYTTETWAGEYDVVQCPPGTPSTECVQEISARWQVKDMVDCTYDPDCHERSGSGINLIYAGGHCHAPSCLSMELYNVDTGELLCRQEPVFGSGSGQTYDELGYIALPPCLWGPASEGLVPPTLLSWNTNLMSIKRNNNTYTHYGEMASWQMRGVFV